jgi:hypothetical protein
MERHETPNPARSDAVNSRFQCVRQQAHRHDQHESMWNMVPVVLM